MMSDPQRTRGTPAAENIVPMACAVHVRQRRKSTASQRDDRAAGHDEHASQDERWTRSLMEHQPGTELRENKEEDYVQAQ